MHDSAANGELSLLVEVLPEGSTQAGRSGLAGGPGPSLMRRMDLGQRRNKRVTALYTW